MGLRSFAIHAKVDSRTKLLSVERLTAEVCNTKSYPFQKFVHEALTKSLGPSFEQMNRAD